MKILHLIYDHASNPWVGGGGAVRARELSERLAKRGHEVTMVCGMFPGADDYKEAGIAYRFAGCGRNYLMSTFSYALSAARFVRRHAGPFDVVVEDFAPWNPVFSPLLTRKPVVLHVNHREGLNIIKRWLFAGIPFYLIEAVYPGLFRHVTALSAATRKKIKTPSAFVLPAGIGEDALSREGQAVREEGFLLFVGRVEINNKGLDTLVGALGLIEGARLVIAGRGRDEERLRLMARGLDVDFRGFVDDAEKDSLLERAALLVLPSRFEGWGIVVLEAAARGKPVVVSDIPELSYAVEAGFGLSFRKGDARDLAQKIESLLGDPSLREEMGGRARRYAGEFTWDRVAGDYERFLEGVVRH